MALRKNAAIEWLLYNHSQGAADTTITAGITTLTADAIYRNLTINNGGTLKTAGFRVYVREKLLINTGGIISADGGAAPDATGGTAAASGSIGGSAGGGAGDVAAGNAGSAGRCFGGVNGGGPGGGGAGTGGAGGGVTAPTVAAADGYWANPVNLLHGHLITAGGVYKILGGNGGGGGGGDGAAGEGGGGGAGGGVVWIAANEISILGTGKIQANGGAGRIGQSTDTGGGGGGAGGLLLVFCSMITTAGAAATHFVTTGGAGGNKGGGSGNPGYGGAGGLAYLFLESGAYPTDMTHTDSYIAGTAGADGT